MAKGIDSENCYMHAVLNAVQRRDFANVSAETIEVIARFAVEYAEQGYERGYEEAIEEMKELTEASSKMNEKKGRTNPPALRSHETKIPKDVYNHLVKVAVDVLDKQQNIGQCTITVNTPKLSQGIAKEIMAELSKRIKGGALA